MKGRAPTRPPMTMNVHCPHCLTGYELPRSLIGEHGARVRCPGCQGTFVVLREDHEAAGAEPAGGEGLAEVTSRTGSGRTGTVTSGSPAAPETDGGPAYEPSVVAGAVLDVMIEFLGEALKRSRERGTVLSDHGPAILAVWDEYRRRAGAGAPVAEFRLALRDRLGVDLSPRAGQ